MTQMTHIPKKRAMPTKEMRSLRAEQTTACAAEIAEKIRAARDAKTARLRALRLGQVH